MYVSDISNIKITDVTKIIGEAKPTQLICLDLN